MRQVYDGPLPAVDPESRPFWEAAKAHRLRLPRCTACGKFHFYPRSFCVHCHHRHIEWADVSGRGTVYSYYVAHRPAHPAFQDRVPYVVALVDLEEGPRMLTNIVDCPPEQVRIGMPVEVVFRDVTEEISLPCFRPAAVSESRFV